MFKAMVKHDDIEFAADLLQLRLEDFSGRHEGDISVNKGVASCEAGEARSREKMQGSSAAAADIEKSGAKRQRNAALPQLAKKRPPGERTDCFFPFDVSREGPVAKNAVPESPLLQPVEEVSRQP
jgi:hypothetical protein